MLQLAPDGAPSSQSVLYIARASLDITNNKLFIDYGNPRPPNCVHRPSWIPNGFYSLSGPQIISSSVAADDAATGLSYGIGYADSADGVRADLPCGEIEIMYTLLGDANLDGIVNTEDFTPFSTNLSNLPGAWDQGDFNYDGTVNTDDFMPFSHNLNQSASLASQGGALKTANGISLNHVSLNRRAWRYDGDGRIGNSLSTPIFTILPPTGCPAHYVGFREKWPDGVYPVRLVRRPFCARWIPEAFHLSLTPEQRAGKIVESADTTCFRRFPWRFRWQLAQRLGGIGHRHAGRYSATVQVAAETNSAFRSTVSYDGKPHAAQSVDPALI